MIALLNIQTKEIILYTDKGSRTIPFNNLEMLKNFFDLSQEIFYVTNAVKTTIREIIETVEEINENTPISENNTNENLYIRVTVKGTINIPGLKNLQTNQEDEITLRGPVGSLALQRFYDTYGKDILTKSRALHNLLKAGKIEIIPASKLRNIKKEYEIQQSQEEESNSIIIDSSAPGSAAKFADGETSESPKNSRLNKYLKNAAEIDLDNSGTRSLGGRGTNETTMPDDLLWEK